MIKDNKEKQQVANVIKSLYQMILKVNDETMHFFMIDHNDELKTLSGDCEDFKAFCGCLYENVHPEDREAFERFMDPGYFPGVLKNRVFTSLECRLRHTNMHYYWSEITFCHATEEDAAHGHDFIFLMRDIDERKRRELLEEKEQRALIEDLKFRFEELFEENMRDDQTGCYNRKGMKYYTDIVLRQAKEEGKHVFVCVADVNGLKYLNDTFGHSAGDEAIAVCSGALRDSAPKGSRIVRTGGDEFLLMAALDPDDENPGKLGEKVDRIITDYNREHDRPYKLGVSYGTVFRSLAEGENDIDEFVETADAKMYDMKFKRDEHRRE
jgi:diguanylate cyclase (GGDEF)-like protein